MKRMSVAEAKALFSELVADARRGRKTVILRHGRPCGRRSGDAAIDAVVELKAGRR